jgi:hypothetical protein
MKPSVLGCVLVVFALAGAGCGRYGPPVRAAERAAAAPAPGATSPGAEPEEPAEPAAPGQEP